MHKETKCFSFGQFCILIVYLTTSVTGDNKNISCPRFCKCDSYLQLNRAQCSSKNLLSAEVDLPKQVQILDLSYNDITTVDNKCFENFSHLKYINLSHNALHTIDWNAFLNLRRLIEIDLSYNRLEYLDEKLFEGNRYLNKINLEGNKLESLQNKPLIEHRFVSELSLKNAQLNFVPPQMFAGLPNLKRLDLSNNLLNNFNVEDFQNLKQLQELNLNENSIKCDEIVKNKLKLFEKKTVKVLLDKCSSGSHERTQSESKMFEKIIMSTAQAPTRQEPAMEIAQWRLNLEGEEELYEENENLEWDIPPIGDSSRNTNEWLRFAPDAILCNKQNFILCQEYRSCLQDLNNVWHEQHKCKQHCPLNDVKLAFVMGIAIGVAAIVFILACALCMKKCLETKKSAPDPFTDPLDDLPNQPLARLTTQLPPQVRRQPRRRAARPARSLVRYEGPVAENFLSRLFGRPARHQYYRTINQNTATLIRRLSRSNLFNNRLSQHFIERQMSQETNSSPEIQNYSASAPRPETPPPSYVDVVIKTANASK